MVLIEKPKCLCFLLRRIPYLFNNLVSQERLQDNEQNILGSSLIGPTYFLFQLNCFYNWKFGNMGIIK